MNTKQTILGQEIKEALICRLDNIEEQIKANTAELKRLEERYKLLADYLMKGEDMKCPKCEQEVEKITRGRCDDCRKVERLEQRREWYDLVHKKPEEKKRPKLPEVTKTLDEFQKEAAAQGLSYGQLQALQTIRQQRGQ